MNKETINTIQNIKKIHEQVQTINILLKKKIAEKSDAPKDCRDRKIKELEDRIIELEKTIANLNKK